MRDGPTAEGWGVQPTRLAMSFCVSPQPASLRNCSGSMFGTMLSASSRSSLAVASLLMGIRASDGGGRQDRGKNGLATQENQRPNTQLRIRAFCPGTFAFLAVFRVVEENECEKGKL